MANWLKRGSTAAARADLDRKVRDVVETTLADIEMRGDAAIRELSVKFDGWDREDYRLSDREIQGCLGQLTGQEGRAGGWPPRIRTARLATRPL